MIGMIGKKCGMTRVFSDDGQSVPVTIIQANPNRINCIKSSKTDGYKAIQVTTGQVKSKIKKPTKGQYVKNNINPGVMLREFKLNNHEAEQVESGKEITVSYFKKGELVDVVGKTIGKGFAGVVKRHNFSMQDATHGNSLAHRAPGSIGQNQTPGRVFKGKKMAGHMGNVRKTSQNLEVIEIDEDRNLLFIKGSIAGHVNSDVIIMPAIKSKQDDRKIFQDTQEAEVETQDTQEAEVETQDTQEAEVETQDTQEERETKHEN